ncbi:MAG: non-canonical purine NTP pyrophosphatase [Spirochaetes bacterium]|nr:non-canonical purine NTP pyrophosphatase [Spirochaetota bacterium]
MEIIFATQNKHKIDEVNNKLKSFFNNKNDIIYNLKFINLSDLSFYEDIEESGKTFNENAKIKCEYIFEKFKKPVIGEDSGLTNLLLTFSIKNFGKDYFINNLLKNFLKYIETKNILNNFGLISNKIMDFFNFALYEKDISILPGVFSKRFCFIDETEERNKILLNLVYYLKNAVFDEIKFDYKNFLFNFLEELFKENKDNKSLNKLKNLILEEKFCKLYNDYYFFSYFTTSIYFKSEEKEIEANGYIFGYLTDPKGNYGFGYDPIFYVPELQKTLAELQISEKNLVSHRQEAFEIFINKLLNNFF